MNFSGSADEVCAVVDAFFDRVAAVTENIDDDFALAHALSACHKVKQAVALGYGLVCDPLAARMEPRVEPIPTTDGLVEIRQSRPRSKWEHDDLKRIVAKRVVEMHSVMETGQLTGSPEDLVRDALEVPGAGAWRVKQLAALGLDADDYCVSGVPKMSVSVKGV